MKNNKYLRQKQRKEKNKRLGEQKGLFPKNKVHIYMKWKHRSLFLWTIVIGGSQSASSSKEKILQIQGNYMYSKYNVEDSVNHVRSKDEIITR